MDTNFTSTETFVHLYLLGKTRAVKQTENGPEELSIQPKPLHLLAFLALNADRPHRREALQALFWPDKSASSAANNLRQTLWHLRRTLPAETLDLQGDTVGWNLTVGLWVDALTFEAALDADDLDTALALYRGSLLPDTYDEWAQLQRERLHLRYLAALEARAQHHYQARRWDAALADTETLLTTDPLNEAAVCLNMACYWALGQREAARRAYKAYREWINSELGTDPLPETTALYQRILRGEIHPDQSFPAADEVTAAETAHLSLLETLGAFRQGLESATTWAAEAGGAARAIALRWQGRFYLRMGQLADSRAALIDALSLAESPDAQAVVLADLATTETGLGDYEAAEEHYAQALGLLPPGADTRVRLLSSLGGLQGRMGRSSEARLALEQAVRLARDKKDPAPLAIASGNLGILLLGQGEAEAAGAVLQEALNAARRADAHWLTAHLTGHLGLLAQDRKELETAADHYQRARFLAETIGDQRCATLWILNLGVVRYEQGRCEDALSLLTSGREQAAAQGVRSLEAGASIFIGACLVAQGNPVDGLDRVEGGLALAKDIGDHERILMGYLHRGRALIALERVSEARATLQEGVRRAEASRMFRLGDYLGAELESLSTLS